MNATATAPAVPYSKVWPLGWDMCSPSLRRQEKYDEAKAYAAKHGGTIAFISLMTAAHGGRYQDVRLVVAVSENVERDLVVSAKALAAFLPQFYPIITINIIGGGVSKRGAEVKNGHPTHFNLRLVYKRTDRDAAFRRTVRDAKYAMWEVAAVER